MDSTPNNARPPLATSVNVSAETIAVDLVDGRTIRVPVGWYPRLANATPAERSNWRPIGHGEGIHWPDLDEDIRVEDLLEGRASSESEESFGAWLSRRRGPRFA